MKPLFVMLILLLAVPVCADTIIFKDGSTKEWETYWEEGDNYCVAQYGGIAYYPKNKIASIEEGQSTPYTSVAGKKVAKANALDGLTQEANAQCEKMVMKYSIGEWIPTNVRCKMQYNEPKRDIKTVDIYGVGGGIILNQSHNGYYGGYCTADYRNVRGSTTSYGHQCSASQTENGTWMVEIKRNY